jgi:hypothetical protein
VILDSKAKSMHISFVTMLNYEMSVDSRLIFQECISKENKGLLILVQ